MAIWRKTVKAGNVVKVREGCSTVNRGRGGKKRRLKTEPTTEEQAAINRNRQIDTAGILLNGNFGKGDEHIVCGYQKDKRPADRKAAERDRNNFIRRLNYWCEKEGIKLKWFAVTEVGKRGALHHHLVITGGLAPKKLNELWPYGRVHITPLEENGDYTELAEYLIKKTDWEYAHIEEMKGRRRFSTSQNLVRPKPKTKRSKRKQIDTNPKPWKGYYIPKESIYQSKDQYTGADYITYRMVKLVPDFTYREKYRKTKRQRK